MNKIDKSDFDLWMRDPCTKLLFKLFDRELKYTMESILTLATSSNMENFNSIRDWAGRYRVYNILLDLDYNILKGVQDE